MSYSDIPLTRMRAGSEVGRRQESPQNVEYFYSPPRILAFMGASGSGKDVALETVASIAGRRGISQTLELSDPVMVRIVPKIVDCPLRQVEASKESVTPEAYDTLLREGNLFGEYTASRTGCRYAYRSTDFQPNASEEFLATEPSLSQILELKEQYGDLVHCTFLAASRSYRERLLIKRGTDSPSEIRNLLNEGDGVTFVALHLAGKPLDFINRFIDPGISEQFQDLLQTNIGEWETLQVKEQLSQKVGAETVNMLQIALSKKTGKTTSFVDDIIELEDKFITEESFETGLFTESVIDSVTRMLLNSEDRGYTVDQTANANIICNLRVPESPKFDDSIFGIPYEKIFQAIRSNQKDRAIPLEGSSSEKFNSVKWVSYYVDRNHVFGLIIRDPRNPELMASFRANAQEGSDEALMEYQIELGEGLPPEERYGIQMAFMKRSLKICEELGINKFHYVEHFDMVDEMDNVIGIVPRSIAHESPKYIHRASSVLLWRLRKNKETGKDALQLLMVRRSKNKKMNANLLQASASGHLLPGESYAGGARRELREEIGSNYTDKVKELKLAGKARVYSDETTSKNPQREHFSFFTGYVDERNADQMATNYETDSASWMDVEEVRKRLDEHPEEFRDAFKFAFEAVDWNNLQAGASR